MRSWLTCLSVTIACAALLFGALPAAAKLVESQDNSFFAELDQHVSAFKAQAERTAKAAAKAAAHAAHDGKGALADAQSDVSKQLEKFRAALNAQKATLGMIGEDVAARLETWRQESLEAWATWPESWAEMNRSTTEMLDWFHDWFKKHSAPSEPTQIPV